MIIFKTLCHIVLFLMELVLGLWLPLKQTLHHMEMSFRGKGDESKLKHWSYYWIAKGILFFVAHDLLFFFPFAYETRVIASVLTAHPSFQEKASLFVKQ